MSSVKLKKATTTKKGSATLKGTTTRVGGTKQGSVGNQPPPENPASESRANPPPGYIRVCCNQCSGLLLASLEEGGQPVNCPHCNEFLIVPRSNLSEHVVLGDFVIKERLGEGGAGTVYLAYQYSLDRLCALKVMHDNELAHQDQLIKEARLAGRLNHPNITQCYSVNATEDLCYYAMEYVRGRTLTHLLKRKIKLSPSKALEIMIQVAEALAYAWREQRLIHQDIKNDNIMINEDEEVKLADFGLARLVSESSDKRDSTLNCTPAFACPEEIRGDPVDFRGDMYSLGVVFYCCITGTLPFNGDAPQDFLTKHLYGEAEPPEVFTPDLPAEFSECIMTLLEKNPDDRYIDYEVFLKTLRRLKVLSHRHELASAGLIPFDQAALNTEGLTTTTGTLSPAPPAPPQHHIGDNMDSRLLVLSALLFGVVFALGLLASGLMLYRVNGNFENRVNNILGVTSEDNLPRTGNAGILQSALEEEKKSGLKIESVLPDPPGYDAGKEHLTIRNHDKKTWQLDGITLVNRRSEGTANLKGEIPPKALRYIPLPDDTILLNNNGDQLTLKSKDGNILDVIIYDESQVAENIVISFGDDANNK